MARFKKNRARQPPPRPAKPTDVSKQAEESKPTAASGFYNLPPEIFQQILGEVKSQDDLNSLSRCNRGLYFAILDVRYTREFEELVLLQGGREESLMSTFLRALGQDSRELVLPQGGREEALLSTFLRAVRQDSRELIEWLLFREHGSQLRGLFRLVEGFTPLHYALLQDAPKVAIQLLKHGAELNEDEALYPDLKSLYVAIAQPHSNRIGALDGPLRIACSYALPRTAEYLLIRGADPNTHSDFGFAAIHIAVRQRTPWGRFGRFLKCNRVGGKSPESVDKRRDSEGDQKKEENRNSFRKETRSKKTKAQWNSTKAKEKDSTSSPGDESKDTQDKDPESTAWEAKVLQTVEVLLRFGADCNLPALNSRQHKCSHECWKSLSCAPIQQRVLHIAAASGYASVVSALVKRNADIFQADGQGNRPIVHAMAQDHGEIVAFLMEKMEQGAKSKAYRVNPRVCETTRSTVLHMACRFGHDTVVSDLLKRGADVNGVDSRGRTPLHEALGQSAPDLEDRLVETLYILSENDANQEAVDYDGRRAGDMGEKHRLSGVRKLFEYATMARYDWQRLTESKSNGEADSVGYVPPPDPSWFVNEEPEVPPQIHPDLASMKAPVWVKKDSFPQLKGPGTQPKVADPTPNRGNSAGSPRMAPELLDTAAPVKKAEMAETERPTGTEEPAETNEKRGKGGGRKKWNRVPLK
ncbi:uncharacterized protein Triagg1_6037 [Trichoderma aggressivum f. europaeum]|uniref:F-box domain-containing protein n=1 Tax=Trichoderma aggressivum f. europaeum TaxID=173218 RepID=A0AAE1M209_9HYPO|nr:hypothetical protein Triagg1_6037 [Trichoderma aggressivum f. europaeum]